jgi:hypothetical protein
MDLTDILTRGIVEMLTSSFKMFSLRIKMQLRSRKYFDTCLNYLISNTHILNKMDRGEIQG